MLKIGIEYTIEESIKVRLLDCKDVCLTLCKKLSEAKGSLDFLSIHQCIFRHSHLYTWIKKGLSLQSCIYRIVLCMFTQKSFPLRLALSAAYLYEQIQPHYCYPTLTGSKWIHLKCGVRILRARGERESGGGVHSLLATKRHMG